MTDEGPSVGVASIGEIMTRRAATIKMIASISAIIISLECLTAGLAANASANMDKADLPTDAYPEGIIIVALVSFLEIIPFLIAAFCFLFCNFHLVYFLSIALIAVSAMGTGAYGLVIMAMGMNKSACGDSTQCSEALKKGLAASCCRTFLM